MGMGDVGYWSTTQATGIKLGTTRSDDVNGCVWRYCKLTGRGSLTGAGTAGTDAVLKSFHGAAVYLDGATAAVAGAEQNFQVLVTAPTIDASTPYTGQLYRPAGFIDLGMYQSPDTQVIHNGTDAAYGWIKVVGRHTRLKTSAALAIGKLATFNSANAYGQVTYLTAALTTTAATFAQLANAFAMVYGAVCKSNAAAVAVSGETNSYTFDGEIFVPGVSQ